MTKRAVIVGINDYSVQGIISLNYCVRDAGSMYHLLTSAFGFDPADVFYYTDAAASSTNIRKALNYIIRSAQPGDVACFYYSGHGARIPANSAKVDCDKYYETIIPASGQWISDQDIFQIANQLDPDWCNFTVILDSCHSGGIHETDAVEKCRSPRFQAELVQRILKYMQTLIPIGITLPFDSDVLKNNVQNVTVGADGLIDFDEDPDRTLVAKSRSTLIAGCKFDELSWEHPDYSHGLLTQSFLDLIDSSSYKVTYVDLLDKLRSKVAEKMKVKFPGKTQTPQLRGQQNRTSENFLEGWNDSR